jgi:c-di-GMP-related signal transduction protein
VLDLVSAYERGDWAHLDDLRRDLPVDDSALDRAYVESVEWAEVTAH